MKLDVQEINHNYVTRMVIFAIFTFKSYRKEEGVYFQMINNFLRRKVGYQIDLRLEVGPKMSLQDQRELVIDSLINDDELNFMNLVTVEFKTGFKSVNLQIDINDEDKYEQYLYA